MNEAEHQELRINLGAYVLGHLSAEDARQVSEHLASCGECRAELDELMPAANALSVIRGTSPMAVDDRVPLDLGPRIITSVDRARRHEVRSRWFRTAGAAGVAAAVAAAVLVAGLALTRPEVEPVAPVVPLETVRVTVDQVALKAAADLVAHTWGVEVKLRGSGFERGARYRVTLIALDGTRHSAGEFVGTGSREMNCNLNSSVLRDQAEGFEVLDAAGTVVVSSVFEA